MIHFVFTASWKMEDTPFGAELRRLKVPHIFFCEDVSLQYYSFSSLLFRIYPKLAWFAFKTSIRSMILSRPSPTAIVVSSEVEALVFGVIRKIFRKRSLVIF